MPEKQRVLCATSLRFVGGSRDELPIVTKDPVVRELIFQRAGASTTRDDALLSFVWKSCSYGRL
jgi:hypothetical protein